MNDYQYVGTELEMFGQARNWKQYLRARIGPFLGLDVLEVGAGIGGTTRVLVNNNHRQWLCLEPDPSLAEELEKRIDQGELPEFCQARVGTLTDISSRKSFDTILYVDVLEHIEDDLQETINATERLKPGGRLVVLAPAHQWLFTEFDKCVGHYRRYNRRSLLALTREPLVPERFEYLDSCGCFASLANRLILKSEMPSMRQIIFWDRILVSLSRYVDPLIGRRAGKSILGVWRRRET